jgi:undecaprenyl-diphosphatase
MSKTYLKVDAQLGIRLMTSRKSEKRKESGTAKYPLHILVLNLFCLYIYLKLAQSVNTPGYSLAVDNWLNATIVVLWAPLLTKMMIFVSNIASTLSLLTLSLIVFIFLVYRKRWCKALLFGSSMLIGLGLELLTKSIVHRARPADPLVTLSRYSFPSGHATMALIFFSLLIYLFKDDIKDKLLKVVFVAVGCLIILSVGLSRIYLHAHWFSDVIAGFALGGFVLTGVMLVFKVIGFFRSRPLAREL